LAAAEQEPPDLILLDISMPEMNGYEVCEKLKADVRLAGIPVIFLSALNDVEDKVRAFAAGGADYIARPFQFEEVRARVDTQIKLARAQQVEHDLLQRTLGGAVRTLWDVIQITSPMLAMRSKVIRDAVMWMAKASPLSNIWQVEIAANLSLLGCMVLPEDVFEKGYFGQPLTAEEERMFRAHPESGANLISHIPRLEAVAEMIRRQHVPDRYPHATEQIRLGARMLQLAMEFDRCIGCGGSRGEVLSRLAQSRRFDQRLLDALAHYVPADRDFELRKLPLTEVCAGMILESDLFSKDGNILILKGGTSLTDTWIERLRNFNVSRADNPVIGVRVPKPPELKL
jgi:response regulator RpfG family c-di-GMP phosphodiesterase